jgi:APA family basic amino acid/polyamine antiporter
MGLGGFIAYELMGSVFPNGSLVPGFLVFTVLAFGIALPFVYLSAVMPRSGGDYPWTTRILGPVPGFIGSLVMNVINIYYLGSTAELFAIPALSSTLYSLAYVTGNSSYSSAGAYMYTPTGIFIVATIVVALTILVHVFGWRVYLKVQYVSLILALIGFLFSIAVLSLHTPSDFAKAVNTIAGSPNAYANFSASSANVGSLSSTNNKVIATLGVGAAGFFTLAFAWYYAYAAGEIRGGSKLSVHLRSQFISILISGGLIIALFVALQHAIGNNNLMNLGYLWYNNPKAYPISDQPTWNYLATLVSPNILVALVAGIGMLMWAWLWVVMSPIWPTRALFAWSFDGMIPRKFAQVNERFRVPLWTLLVNAIGGEAYVFALAFIPVADLLFIFQSAALGSIFVFILVALAAILYPFRWKQQYEASAAKKEIAGIPIMTLGGIFALIVEGFYGWYFLTFPGLGVGTEGEEFLVIVAIIAVIFFFISRAYRRRQGIDIGLAFKQLPPE